MSRTAPQLSLRQRMSIDAHFQTLRFNFSMLLGDTERFEQFFTLHGQAQRVQGMTARISAIRGALSDWILSIEEKINTIEEALTFLEQVAANVKNEYMSTLDENSAHGEDIWDEFVSYEDTLYDKRTKVDDVKRLMAQAKEVKY